MHLFKGKPFFDPNDLNSVIKACLEYNQQAQKTLIRQFYGFAKSISLKYVSNNELAEEIINDSFLKVFTNLYKYDPMQPFKAWLRTIIVNTAIDYYRKSQKYIKKDDLENVEIFDLEPDAISNLSAEDILKFIQHLTPAYRMVFTLYVIDGYTHKEIADMLGIKEGTSKSNLQDARKKLQTMILKANPNMYLAYELKNRLNNEN
jgi:RNA polymerase sigma-70 factor (ECF subfamily)